ncbi:MAG TPA: hypothetical protein VLE49_13550 [Anaerolineales bacterium]|jgi:hypothetical protein|nr:hypothetical protein [Anaerolineales bacterium]
MNELRVTSMLIERLEHIPADSIWAHRASGIRRQLWRILEQSEGDQSVNSQTIRQSYESAFHILSEAAPEKHR